MNLAFALYKYFPYGGLQRDMLRIAQTCTAKGACVTVYCSDWQGDRPDNIDVVILPTRGFSNHVRNSHFSKSLLQILQQQKPDLLIGFNKMPGLDIYYAADTCFKAKLMQERSPLLRLLPRYRQHLRDENAVFGTHSHTRILAIAERSVDEYEQHYPGCSARCTVLPPGINPDRRAGPDAASIRHAFRSHWQLTDDERLVLMIGSGFRTKGLDRAIRAVASLPQNLLSHTRFMVIGQDNPEPFQQLAKQLQVDRHIQFFKGRDDIPHFLLGADTLIHPAYRENTGTVLLEAAVAGLPVLTTAVCGYSHYIRDHQCGAVINEPFQQQQLNQHLAQMLVDKTQRQHYSKNGLAFAANTDIYSLFARAADIIVNAAHERSA